MILNPDLIRDIILITEKLCTPTFVVDNNDLQQELGNNYDKDTLYYHASYLGEANMIKIKFFVDGSYRINDLTVTGHEFAQNIHCDTIWNKTKDTAKKVGSYSLDTLKEIAVASISVAISTAINQTKF